MSIADLMKAMADAGAPIDAIILAVRAIEEKDAVIEARREGDRERKRRQRERAGTVTGQSQDTDGTVAADPPPSPSPSFPPDPQTNPTPAHPRETTPRARKGADFDLPDRIPAEPWADFLAMRKRIGKPLTPRAMELAVIKLDKLAADGWPPGDVLNHSTLNAYQGLFPPEDRKNGTGNRNYQPRPTVSSAIHAARNRLGAGKQF